MLSGFPSDATEQESPFIKIAVLEMPSRLSFLSSVLTQYEIPHRLARTTDTAYDGLFQLQKGWGDLWPHNVRQHVLDALSNWRSKRWTYTTMNRNLEKKGTSSQRSEALQRLLSSSQRAAAACWGSLHVFPL